jgi:hypothetical protein
LLTFPSLLPLLRPPPHSGDPECAARRVSCARHPAGRVAHAHEAPAIHLHERRGCRGGEWKDTPTVGDVRGGSGTEGRDSSRPRR